MKRTALTVALLAALLPLGAQADDRHDDHDRQEVEDEKKYERHEHRPGAAQRHATEQRGCESGPAPHGWMAKSLRVAVLTTDHQLLCVDERRPHDARSIGKLSGLVTDTALVGIDYRVQDGLLYGVGNHGGVYRIDTRNARASLVNRLSVALSGQRFGVDFNPAADRLRIVSDTGQNLRHNLNVQANATIADTPLNNGATPPASVAGIQTTAYTNNDLETPVAPATAVTNVTQFVLNGFTGQFAIQSPPNNGIVFNTARTGIAAERASLDIHTTLRKGLAVDNDALMALRTRDRQGNLVSALYAVDPLTGASRLRGSFRHDVLDIAIPLNQK